MNDGIFLTSHQLAQRLLSLPDLVCVRRIDGDDEHLKPLSHVCVMTPGDEDMFPMVDFILIDTAPTTTRQNNPLVP